MSQPIISFVTGIDEHPRNLSPAEVEGLTDWFGQWLARTPVPERALSLRSLLNDVLPPNSYNTFAVADGTPIVYRHDIPDHPLNSVSRHLRFIIIVLPDGQRQDGDPRLDLTQAIVQRTICLVASRNPDGTGSDAFLQCASWDPNGLDADRQLGIMRFYGRLRDGWVFQGDSLNAVSLLNKIQNVRFIYQNIHQFKSLSMDVGPFDG